MPQRINYTLSMQSPNTHYFHVRIDLLEADSVTRDAKLRVSMPVWTPGSYLIREFSRNVLEFSAFSSGNGSELKTEKESKNTWIVHTGGVSSVSISYRVYAFEFTVDTSYLDTRHGIVNGASVFMYVEGTQSWKHILKINPFKEWKVIATGLEKISDSETTYISPNFDVLIDSPIELGNQEIHSFSVSGIKHEVSLFGPSTVDSNTFVSDLKKIVEHTWTVFGEIPYNRYVFIVDFAGAATGGGLEHLNSTHCIVPRLRMQPVREYKSLLTLFSHEFFHTWNVKRLRPKGLGPFDYAKETYTKSLWIAEGITSYYDDLILRRSEIFSVPEYLDEFSINASHVVSFPSSRFESAEESSFDTWIKHYRPDQNTPNAHSSYYFQGAVIGWMIDMEIRHSTGNRKSLDEVMRAMYEKTFSMEARGYSEEEFEACCDETAGRSVSEIFDARVRGRKRVDFDNYLGYAGLKLGPKSKNEKSKGFLGVKLKTEGGRVIVASKLFDTPAEVCGLAPGDEILALDNLRMDLPLVSHYISNKRSGDRVRIEISRDGYLGGLEATLAPSPSLEHRVYKLNSATEDQKGFFKAWLLSDWELPVEYEDYTPSPQKPKPFEYI